MNTLHSVYKILLQGCVIRACIALIITGLLCFGLRLLYKKIVPEHKANILLKNKKIIFYGKDSTINFTHVDYGLMILKKNIFINIKKKNFDLNLIFNKLIEQNQVKYFCVKKRFYEIGSIKGIKRFKKIINK